MKTKAFKSIQPGDMVVMGERSWTVIGVYLGCLEQENGIGIKPIGVSGPCVPRHGIQHEMIVPLDMIPASAIYRPVDHEAAKAAPRLVAAN